jgi:hypothetical protein
MKFKQKLKFLLFNILLLTFASCSTHNINRELSSTELVIDCSDLATLFFDENRSEETSNLAHINEFFEAFDMLNKITLSKNIQLINNSFLHYAESTNLKFIKRENDFKILPDPNGNLLNQLAYKISKERKEKFYKDEIEFVFDPEVSISRDGQFDLEETKIWVSLKAIFKGGPTVTEVHEVHHLDYFYHFLEGRPSLFKVYLNKGKAKYLAFEKFAYGQDMHAEEILTYAEHLFVTLELLKHIDQLSPKARENLLEHVRSLTKNLFYINLAIYKVFENIMASIKKNAKFPFTHELSNIHGRTVLKLAHVNYYSVDLSRLDKKSLELIYAHESARSDLERDKIDDSIRQIMASQFKDILTIAKTLLYISHRLHEKKDDNNFLTSIAFSENVTQFRALLQRAEQKFVDENKE